MTVARNIAVESVGSGLSAPVSQNSGQAEKTVPDSII